MDNRSHKHSSGIMEILKYFIIKNLNKIYLFYRNTSIFTRISALPNEQAAEQTAEQKDQWTTEVTLKNFTREYGMIKNFDFRFSTDIYVLKDLENLFDWFGEKSVSISACT